LAAVLSSYAADPSPDPVIYDPGIPAVTAVVVTNPAASSTQRTAPTVSASVESASGTNGVVAGDPKPSVMDTLDDKHRLAVGDRVSFRILEDEEEPRPLIVTDSGEIEVPYIGRFMATEKTCKELALALKAELEKEYYYQATVMVGLDLMARSRGKVYLVGPVRAPGPQEIPSDEVLTISKAILRAGGFLETADKKNVRISRKKVPGPGEEMMTVNVADILEKGKTEGDLVLQIGDLIYIPERLIRF
jgi:polysaccharide export outer membrane protein